MLSKPRMNFSNPLRAKLAKGATTYGMWVTLESASVTELICGLGIDWICIDMEHGCLDFRHVLDHLRASKGSDTAVLVRVPTTSVDNVKRALDLGASGVLLPLIRNAEELAEGFMHARYPSLGRRGLGGERATNWGMALQEYVSVADEEVMVIPVIETQDASRNIESILDTEGLEAILFGPADLSQSFGHRAAWEGPGIADEILRIKDLATARNITSGVVGRNPDDIGMRKEQGFRMIGIGSDIGLMAGNARQVLGKIHGAKIESAWF